MNGFLRQGQVTALRRIQVLEFVSAFEREQEIAHVLRAQDPFHVDDPCLQNEGAPHSPIICANDLVCEHCSKVFWPFCAKVYHR